jgi:GNAT superfamily N-acetyltransferase
MPIEISPLADHPELIDQLVEGYEAWSPAWYGPGGKGDARADLVARTRYDGVPCGLVAVEDGMAAGTCGLAEESMSLKGEFGAWLVGLWVAPSHRGRGLAGRLLQAAADKARALRISELRAGTTGAERVFERAGWTRLEPIVHEGVLTQIFSIRPAC